MPINSPLYVLAGKKKIYLNLNVYRNTHYQSLNKAKIAYKELMRTQIELISKMDRVSISYVLYPKTKRLTDIGNVIAIHKKFFEDALVEFGIIPDDNYLHVVGSCESFGEVDKDNPRVEISMRELEKER